MTPKHFNRLTIPILFGMFSLISHNNVIAQYFRPHSRTYLGFEASAGNRQFTIKSNIVALDNYKVEEAGYTLGILAGKDAIMARAQFGSFKTGRLAREKVFLTEKKIGFNIFPLKIAGVKSKFIKPYVIANFDFSTLKFYGTYALPPKPPAMPAAGLHCPDGGHMPEEPAPVEEIVPPSNEISEADKVERMLGKVNVSRFNTGLGVNVHIPGRRKFVNLFAESSYGFVMGTKAFMTEFEETRFSNQFTTNVGICIGLMD